MKAFDKAIELKSDYANAYYNKGNSLWHLGKYEEAIEEYNKAIGLNPDDAIAYSNKGTALFELKRYEEAIKEYDKTIELNPDNAIAYYSKGNAYNFLKQYDEAIKCCNKAVELDPKYAPKFCHKGYALYGLKKHQEAIIEYNKAIALDPKYENAIVDKRMVLDAIACQARDKDFEVLLENTPLSPGARKVAEQKIASLKSLQNGSNKKSYVEKYLNYLFRLPWGKYDEASIDIIEAEKILNNNHYGLISVKQKIIESLVFMANSKNAKPPILCLVGAPGVGKTSIAKIISKALNRNIITCRCNR
ncbi:tetratricopeptide repeat protein [Candidatus Rickettsia colombianensi]|uniref:tetratricopeptide repeat protein n=1 Tax=Candidatus Rickettsia colombianensi TaxID=1090944 RepID=UPI000EF2685A|nr:tetratricopeptide repeat protein [Candidatus Rickettsia colombianensi]